MEILEKEKSEIKRGREKIWWYGGMVYSLAARVAMATATSSSSSFFLRESCVSQACLEPLILLSSPPKCCDAQPASSPPPSHPCLHAMLGMRPRVSCMCLTHAGHTPYQLSHTPRLSSAS